MRSINYFLPFSAEKSFRKVVNRADLCYNKIVKRNKARRSFNMAIKNAYLKELLERDDFINYIASLKKYKSGGYYTFNSKDLELYLNFNISQRIKNGSLTVKNNDEHRLFESGLSLFQGIS